MQDINTYCGHHFQLTVQKLSYPELKETSVGNLCKNMHVKFSQGINNSCKKCHFIPPSQHSKMEWILMPKNDV